MRSRLCGNFAGRSLGAGVLAKTVDSEGRASVSVLGQAKEALGGWGSSRRVPVVTLLVPGDPPCEVRLRDVLRLEPRARAQPPAEPGEDPHSPRPPECSLVLNTL